MDMLLVAGVAFGASMLTFFSGFGLGTLLLPVFALMAPVEAAVMMTAVVHLSNNLFKLSMMAQFVDRTVVLRFGLPALASAWLGAWLLLELSTIPPLGSWAWAGHSFPVTWTGLVVGVLVVIFALRELSDLERQRTIPARWLPLGGLLSGFFGGLSGHQGALRTSFLIGLGLSKEAFVASGVAIACVVDLSRLSLYLPNWRILAESGSPRLMGVAVLAAFAGAWLGRRWLRKLTLGLLHRVVGVLLLIAGLGLAAGVI